MRLAIILSFALTLSACALPDYDTSWPDPRGPSQEPPRQTAGGADPIEVEPEGDSRRARRQDAAQRCAQYGRAASGGGGDEYGCVPRSQAPSGRDAWDH